MDLSLLSDTDIRALDARIRAFWLRGLRCTLGADGEARVRSAVYDELRIRLEGGAMSVSWNGEGIGWHFIDEPKHTTCAPTSADEAWEAWRAALQRVFHEVHHWRVNGRATGPYRIVCDATKPDEWWLARTTLMSASRERLKRILGNDHSV